MKQLFILLFLAFFAGNFSSHAQDISAPVEQIVNGPILFVIKVPVNAENVEQINKLKGMEAEGVLISETTEFLLLQYQGDQLTSDVDPEFIKEISVFKGEKAKQAYPNAPENGVIEMLVEDADTLVKVFYAIKAS